MAKNQASSIVGKKRRAGVKVSLGKRKLAGGALAGSGPFTYRGLRILPSFVGDERSEQLEKSMREYALRTHVLVD
jgi:hypothetical protein